jgi:excisionase family DNA binding protein
MSTNKTTKQVSTPADRLLREPEASHLLGVSRSTLWRYVRHGKITAVKVSERVTGFRLSDIQAIVTGGAK